MEGVTSIWFSHLISTTFEFTLKHTHACIFFMRDKRGLKFHYGNFKVGVKITPVKSLKTLENRFSRNRKGGWGVDWKRKSDRWGRKLEYYACNVWRFSAILRSALILIFPSGTLRRDDSDTTVKCKNIATGFNTLLHYICLSFPHPPSVQQQIIFPSNNLNLHVKFLRFAMFPVRVYSRWQSPLLTMRNSKGVCSTLKYNDFHPFVLNSREWEKHQSETSSIMTDF